MEQQTEILPRLVLYDGHCGMCDATVQWILQHDPSEKFHMAPLQGDTAALILSRHPEIPENLDSIIYVERKQGEETLKWESSAMFSIFRELGLPWSLVAYANYLPSIVTNSVYRFVARHRLKVFGVRDSCRIPNESESSRFLL
jgi:predicted DCC family thiol-disulfide oxidoreductase YuxK